MFNRALNFVISFHRKLLMTLSMRLMESCSKVELSSCWSPPLRLLLSGVGCRSPLPCVPIVKEVAHSSGICQVISGSPGSCKGCSPPGCSPSSPVVKADSSPGSADTK